MVPIFPHQPSWASAIGLFIINFGTLELGILDFLENHVDAQLLAKLKKLHFKDRVDAALAIPGLAKAHPDFVNVLHRTNPLREFRNHIAHCLARIECDRDGKPLKLTLTLPRDLAGEDTPHAQHVSYPELEAKHTELITLIEDLHRSLDLSSKSSLSVNV